MENKISTMKYLPTLVIHNLFHVCDRSIVILSIIGLHIEYTNSFLINTYVRQILRLFPVVWFLVFLGSKTVFYTGITLNFVLCFVWCLWMWAGIVTTVSVTKIIAFYDYFKYFQFKRAFKWKLSPLWVSSH